MPHNTAFPFIEPCFSHIPDISFFPACLCLCPKSLRKPIQIARYNNNKSMYNPQQNININISYNLSQNKQKGPPGKRIAKIQKPAFSSGPCDIQIKLKSKMAEELKKSAEHRLSNDNKKHRKKASNVVGRNTFTPDLFNDRRVRTEGPSAEHPDSLATVKKAKPHSKSMQPAQQKAGVSAKRIGNIKTTKSLKNGHVNSFILINAKKHPLELSESTGIKKRRAQSQTSFAKNDKVVSKLLNMSLLASELGGSRPITSERRSLESHSKTFKEYLSSIDVRILKTMSDDVPIYTRRMHSHQEVVKAIMRSKQISLEELTRKVVVIQRAWKRAMKSLIIKKYRLLFQQATDKLVKEPSHQISAFAAQSIISDLFHPDSQAKEILSSTPLSQSQHSSNSNSLRNSSLQEKSNSYQLKWIQQNNQSEQESEREKLNLTKYRELVMGEISRNKERRCSGSGSGSGSEQAQQWNSLNKKLNVLMNDRKQFDPSTLLDDFIEQSNYNKEWIQNQFQPSSRKESHPNSEEKPADSAEPLSSNERFIREQKERNEEDSLDESQGYDHIKYGSPEEQHEILQRKMRELDRNRRRQRPHNELSNRSESEGSEQKWISPSMMEDNVVRGYLDCGLDDFGLNLNQKIIAIDDKEEGEIEHENEYSVEADEAIGAKFEEANRGIIRKGHQELDSEPTSFILSAKEKQVDQMVETTVQNLISQFAIDISSILKKSTQAPPPVQPDRRPAQSRPQGLVTNFNSIKEYITKFVEFIDRNEENYSKILVNINKDIGPTSLEILSYLRPEEVAAEDDDPFSIEEEGLFVIPTDIFEQFQNEVEEQYKQQHQRQMGPRLRAYTNFWQRCIFESFNECLDYERPYGIEGKPYDWVTETKIFRKVRRADLKQRFKSAEERLFELTLMVGGIIFEKPDSPFANADFSLEDRHRINEERLSRILATELLESEQSWINYNDEMAELLVELARMIEDKVFFEFVAEMKRLQRRRKIIIEETGSEAALYTF